MCTHGRYVFNRYSRRKVFVRCGKCEACRQEKANRSVTRIKNNMTDGMISLFITLTYANDYVPFVYRSDFVGYGDLNVYRRSDIRYVFDRYNGLRLKKDDGIRCIGQVDQFEIDCTDVNSLHKLNGLSDDYIGVCWYPDVQDFYKRLRQILIRDYYVTNKFSYFTCSEYGSCSQRPHFHALLFIKRDDETAFRSAILKAWPYADKTRTAKYIEVARDAAGYVASYVAGNSSIHEVLQADKFKQKYSSSKDFGAVLDCFSLRSILQKVDKRDLQYYCTKKYDGESTVASLPIPLYILHRYFPVCKGFGWLAASQLRAILLDPQKVGDILTDVDICTLYKRDIYDYSFCSHSLVHGSIIVHHVPIRRSCKLINPVYHYTSKETYKIYVRLENAYQRFHNETGLSRYDYAFYYERIYPIYHSMILRLSHEDISMIDEYTDFYENALEVFENCSIAPTLINLPLQLDPNQRKDVLLKSYNLTRLYYLKDKQKHVTNYVMVENDHNV